MPHATTLPWRSLGPFVLAAVLVPLIFAATGLPAVSPELAECLFLTSGPAVFLTFGWELLFGVSLVDILPSAVFHGVDIAFYALLIRALLLKGEPRQRRGRVAVVAAIFVGVVVLNYVTVDYYFAPLSEAFGMWFEDMAGKGVGY